MQPSLDQGIFFRLLLGTVAMLASGYAGEAKFVAPMAGFVFGMAGWGFILFEIFMGPAGQAAGQQSNKYVQSSFNTMRVIVTVGWSIYPMGHFFGFLLGQVNADLLNLVYNLADFANGIALACGHQSNKYVQSSISTMRVIGTVGWSIYSVGYCFGYLLMRQRKLCHQSIQRLRLFHDV